MTRTIQTALLACGHLINASPRAAEVQVWPDLREAHDAICNKGVDRADLKTKFPQLDFSECSEMWDYLPHTIEDATMRAERVRQHLDALPESYKNILLVTHRGFIAFLVQGTRFDVCGTLTTPSLQHPPTLYVLIFSDVSSRFFAECRSYRPTKREKGAQGRNGINCDTGMVQDFGPTLLQLCSSPNTK